MEAVDTTQHVSECNAWRVQLRSYKDELAQLASQLQQNASHQHNKDILTEVEHFQNQFYIQQNNIHNLKHSIRQHEHQLQMEPTGALQEQVDAENMKIHERLFEEFQALDNTIKELKEDFARFLNKS